MKTSIIIGATGLVGGNVLETLISNPEYLTVYIVARKKPENLHSKLVFIPFNSGNYNVPEGIYSAFCCLGTTMKKAGSKEAFLKVDFDMVVEFAKKVRVAGTTRFALVSSIGANPKSANFYLKTKGLAEEELKKVDFERISIVRPSLLLGKRSDKRLGEDIGKALYSVLKYTFIGPLSKYKGVEAKDVAKAMIYLVSAGSGTVIAESNVLAMFSKEYE
jgi:uncharacterized protein YbjT (DUF2867 family)